MPTLKLHYDGWLALPAAFRQALGLSSGDRLEAELVDGALVLRPALKARRSASGAAVPNASTKTDSGEPAPVSIPAKRKPGRPRKVEDQDGEIDTNSRVRGRPRASTLKPEFERAVPPAISLGPPKLVKKVDLKAKAATINSTAATGGMAPRMPRPDRIFQPVERRPFRNVEVRPLGPGRGHNRRQSG